MNRSGSQRASHEKNVEKDMEDLDLLTEPATSIKPTDPSGLSRYREVVWKKPVSAFLLRCIMVGGVLYTVLWSLLLYFGWKGSPDFITWLDLITGIFLTQLAFFLYRGSDITRKSKLLRLIYLASLFYATTWTVIVMFVFGVEILLPLDFISLYVTVSLMRQLWRSLWTH